MKANCCIKNIYRQIIIVILLTGKSIIGQSYQLICDFERNEMNYEASQNNIEDI